MTENRRLMVVPIDTAPTFSPGTPSIVVEGDYYFGGNFRNYDIDPDGSRFLMIKSAPASDRAADPRIVAVLNWFEELESRVPVP